MDNYTSKFQAVNIICLNCGMHLNNETELLKPMNLKEKIFSLAEKYHDDIQRLIVFLEKTKDRPSPPPKELEIAKLKICSKRRLQIQINPVFIENDE